MFDRRIGVNINVVVEVDEIIAGGLAKNDPDGDGQEDTNSRRNPAGIGCGLNWSFGADAGFLSERRRVVCRENTRYVCSSSGGNG
jgi:hypothetical protein